MKEGWEYKPFETCLEKVSKTKKIPSSNYLKEGFYPIVSQEESLINGFHNNHEDIFTVNHPVVIFGDHTRILKYIDFDFVIGADGVKILSPIPSLFPKFFYYSLKSLRLPSLGYSRHYKLLKEQRIPVPPLAEQKQIVEELDLLSGIIEKQKQQLKEFDTLAQSIFYYMFGDPVSNEKGWEVKPLGEIGETGSGGTPYKDINEFWDNGHIPWIGSNMCQNTFIYKTDGKYITELGLEKSSAKLLPVNTVLIALVGATIGKVGILKRESSTNQNIAFVRPNKNFNSIFLFYEIMNLYSLFQNIGDGKFKMANLKFIRNLPIILPPLALQNLFASKIEAIEKQKEAITKSIEETQKLFDYTMDKYFG